MENLFEKYTSTKSDTNERKRSNIQKIVTFKKIIHKHYPFHPKRKIHFFDLSFKCKNNLYTQKTNFRPSCNKKRSKFENVNNFKDFRVLFISISTVELLAAASLLLSIGEILPK